MRYTVLLAVAVLVAASSPVQASVIINGSIDQSGEGWTLLSESGYARPVTGGSSGASDTIAETSTYHWWDDANVVDRAFSTDNRGDVINCSVTWDALYFYVAVAGPTVPFNSWSDPNPGASGDQGDLFVAIDTTGGTPSGSLASTNGHSGWGGTKAVDFLGWTPNLVLGVQYVDNGGGGGGWASLEQTGSAHTQLAGASQGVNNNGFLWNAAVNSSASYDVGGHAGNNNAGEFEFRVPWTMMGLSEAPTSRVLRLAMFTTQNFGQSDAYDSGPGVGNLTDHEEIGDCPGDPDDPSYNQGGVTGTLSAADGLGDDSPPDDGSINGSFPGANYNADVSLAPGHLDGVDTIEEYYSITIPEPSPFILMVGAGFALAAGRWIRRLLGG